MRLRNRDVVLVIGVRGTGKSEYAKRHLVKDAPRVVVWDPVGEYADACDLDEVSLDELINEPHLLEAEDCRLAVVPDWDEADDLAAGFRDFKRLLKRAQHVEGLLVIAEELGAMRPDADKALTALASQSRHWQMPLAFVAQRMMMIPPNARSQATCIISFWQHDPDDLAALAKLVDEGFAAKVAKLPAHRFVVWSDAKHLHEGHRDRREGDSSETAHGSAIH